MTDSEFNCYSRAASQEALAEAGMANLEAGLAKCKTNSLKVNSLSPGLVELRGIEPLTSAVRLHELEQFFAVLRLYRSA